MSVFETHETVLVNRFQQIVGMAGMKCLIEAGIQTGSEKRGAESPPREGLTEQIKFVREQEIFTLEKATV